ncbi:MAG: ABC transporter permease [Deltaproteobacteria bacterium]|nr:MAG: ABC transporter permease [Deltaproteobacteria bacterium]
MDRFIEILQTLARNGTRTALTALSVAWGIFMLVVLLAAGTGLENALLYQFRDDAVNSIWIWPGQTSRPWRGYRVGRRLQLTNADHDAIAALPGVEQITSRFRVRSDSTITYKDRVGDFDIRSCHPAHQYLEKTQITSGRFLNEDDLAQRRKVVVLGAEVVRHLFRSQDPLGEWVDIGGVAYRVIGTFFDDGGLGELSKVYVPITTAQTAYGGGDRVNAILFTIGDMTVAQSQELATEVRRTLASRHNFDPADLRAVRVRNNLERVQSVTGTMKVIRAFLWLVGLGTIAAGVVGVGNIMLVSVAERTGEIGLRKALGATPARVVFEVLQEAVLLTSVSGYAGLVSGVVAVEILEWSLPANDYMQNPEVDLGVAFTAVGVLVVAGLAAGIIPAWRAAHIDAAHAIREGA